MTQAIDHAIDSVATELGELARQLHDDPELAFDEHRSAARIAALLERHAVPVERAYGGLPTSFRARCGRADGPRVAILAEYDALPEIGHACGHNLIAAGAVGAFLGLAGVADSLGGTVEIVGTPAEEGGGGKIRLLEAGVFDGLDAAMMFHPFDRDLLMHDTLATAWLELEFRGKPSHAAIAPGEGRSALTACMDTFRLIDGQRVHMADGTRVHGIITHGGEAVNIIPERASAELSLRAPTAAQVAPLREIAERCARAAAMASAVEVSITARQGYRDMRNNGPLARRFGAHLSGLGRAPRDRDPAVGTGSTDMGDVSYAVPSIHPWLAICDEGRATCHQRAFAACARSDRGIAAMVVAAKAMARTAFDVLADEGLRSEVRRVFEAAPALRGVTTS